MQKIMRFIRGAVPSLLVLAGVVVDMNSAEAIPAFARQTSQACTACHTQHFPTLNSFGRLFKAQGYTMGGSQETVQGEGLDLPGVLNAALVGRLAMEKKKNEDKAIGFPASLSLYFGGRIGKNSGFLMEIPFEGAGAETTVVDGTGTEIGNGSGEVHPEAGPSFAQLGSLKWNYVEDMNGINAGLNAYSSAMAGPAYGYELLSTGAMGMNVAITGANAMGAIGMHMEHGSTLMSAFMDAMESNPNMRMTMVGQATGLGASAQSGEWFAYYSAYFGKQAMDYVPNPSFAHYLRVAWMPTFAGWEMGMGAQIYTGSFGYGSDTAEMTYDAKATTLDFQAQGDVAGRATGIYVTYASTPKSDSNSQLNWYNESVGGDNSAFAILCEMEVVPRLSLNVGYTQATYWSDMLMSDGSVMNSSKTEGTLAQLGANYLLAPNKRLGFKYADFGSDLDSNIMELDLMIGF